MEQVAAQVNNPYYEFQMRKMRQSRSPGAKPIGATKSEYDLSFLKDYKKPGFFQSLLGIGVGTGVMAGLWRTAKHFGAEAIDYAKTDLGKFGNIMSELKPVKWLVAPIVLISLLKTKKAPNDEPKGIIDKSTTFIKNNAGKLTLLSVLPLLVEQNIGIFREFKANNLKILDEFRTSFGKTAKMFARPNAFALSIPLAIVAGIAVRDFIAKPRLVKEKH